LLIFALMTLAVPLQLSRRLLFRQLAPLPFIIGTGLKYFPILGGIVLLEPAPTRHGAWVRAVVTGIGLVLVVWALADDVRNYLAVDWLARGQYTFGAAAIPMKLGWKPDVAVWWARLMGFLFILLALAQVPAAGEVDSNVDRRNRLFALMGAAVAAGNFFLTVGFLYKVIFAVWLLPECLWQLDQKGAQMRLAQVLLSSLLAGVWLMPLVCVSSSQWLAWAGADMEAPLRRLAAGMADLLAWGAMVPAVFMLGRDLRFYWSPHSRKGLS
jgi:hypothetical protein